MIKGRDSERHSCPDRVQPGEIHKVVALVFDIVENRRRGWIDRNLIVVSAPRGYQTQLVIGFLIKDERGKATQAGSLVVDDLRHWSFEAKIGSISRQTAVVSEA